MDKTVKVPNPDEVIPKPEEYPKKTTRNVRRLKPSIEVRRPCPAEVDKYIRAWDDIESYRLQESALNKLFFDLCPENRRIEDILIKIATLNTFYSTHIFAVYAVAQNILSLNIDARLADGDLSLVEDIATVQMANGTERKFYSFATKYCSHHQPKKYTIYDSYVDVILQYFRQEDQFAQFKNSDLKDYPCFHAVLNQFRKFYGLEDYDLKMTDQYLWQLGKAAFPQEYK